MGLGPARLTSLDVKFDPVTVRKITFVPDLPVGVFTPGPSILSHGHKQKKPRRGGRTRRVGAREEVCTVPDTEGYLTDAEDA